MGPAPSGPTRWSTTQAPLMASISRTPGLTTLPETRIATEGTAACTSSRTASLHVELTKVFGPEVLEILLQLVR
jgi:hypothetical protein